jgi:hypothetical protein
MADWYDVLAIGAHPDDLVVVMSGGAAQLPRVSLRVLFLDHYDGGAPRHVAVQPFELMPEVLCKRLTQAGSPAREPASGRPSRRPAKGGER